jgi:propanol-preferring alcohol dehydrogenase
MKAWLLSRVTDMSRGGMPLDLVDTPVPVPGTGQILIRVLCCGVCHTELDEIEGRTPPVHYPVIPGHQVVGLIESCGPGTQRLKPGGRVGVAWIFSACGECDYCLAGSENLCQRFQATGRDQHGGYAEYMVADERFVHPIPDAFSDLQAAPLLCAGAIGYRSLRLAQLSDHQTLALTGFGASGHLVLKMARYLYPHSPIFVFARSAEEQAFARSLGAAWSGSIDESPPAHAHAVIDTTPAWKPVTTSLLNLRPGGRLVINAIRKESHDLNALQDISYDRHLWMEKEVKSVANITRKDVREFLVLAASIPITPEVEEYSFLDANRALTDLKQKHVRGAKVLRVSGHGAAFEKGR